ncbi:hypothetical protein JKP88DRAFT_350935 [Tribonema minus]|uniref:Uncharacterized protein n=1 Tax=Tribonema minus TaxID=303371 RepID=A0A835YKF7_9STRA|nr:hypothetical protein JKP88DRAFT_350935 [Tribonema minus]
MAVNVTRHTVVIQPDFHLRIVVAGLGVLAVVYLLLLWQCWGTLNPRAAARRHKERRALQASYDEAFQRRDDLLYHLDWARQRGEKAEVKNLQGQLEGMLEELDDLESQRLNAAG